jgi:lipid A 4'-phosphatase
MRHGFFDRNRNVILPSCAVPSVAAVTRGRFLMARIAVCLVLAVGIAAGILFAIDPGLDIYISKLVFSPSGRANNGIAAGILSAIREFHIKFFAVVIAVSAGALVLRMMYAKMPMLLPARAAWLILLTYLVGPGLVANAVFKENWARPRPGQVAEFGGTEKFKPWWDPSGTCPKNCSFVSGEASAGFAVLAIAVLAPVAWRLPAIALALGFGIFVGVLRVMAGGHFTSDVVFAGVLTALVVWLLHGLIYRWPATRISESQAEQRVDAVGRLLRAWTVDPLARLFSNARSLRPQGAKARNVRQLDGQPSN